jgi:hypothetical protein
MGSIDYNESFSSLGGNPGSYGYWTMSNTAIGTSWTKVSGYISGFGSSVGQFVSGTKYWTPQALFNYGTGGNSRISGWKVTKVNVKGNKVFDANVTFAGEVLPSADNSKDLGSSSLRWANIYVADAHYSNVGTGGNDVDGTEGSWTIQEGEDDLFLLNRKNGKKYKFKLEEM